VVIFVIILHMVRLLLLLVLTSCYNCQFLLASSLSEVDVMLCSAKVLYHALNFYHCFFYRYYKYCCYYCNYSFNYAVQAVHTQLCAFCKEFRCDSFRDDSIFRCF